jgi:hypothetical protein
MQDPFEESPQSAPDASSFFDSGAASCRFANIGDAHVGTITDFKEAQQRDIKSGEPAFWPDGNKKMMLVITIQTQEHDDQIEDDDGERRLYVNKPSGMFAAISNAIKASKGKFSAGGTLAVKYVKNGKPKTPGFSPPKEYIARYTPPGTTSEAPASQGRTVAPAGSAVALETAISAARKAAWDAFKAANPESPNEALADPWRTLLKAVIPDRNSTTFVVADWNKIRHVIENPPASVPFGDEVQFKEDDIPF